MLSAPLMLRLHGEECCREGHTKDTCTHGQLRPKYCCGALPTKSTTSYSATPIASSLIGAMPEALEMYLHNKTTANPDGCFTHDYIALCQGDHLTVTAFLLNFLALRTDNVCIPSNIYSCMYTAAPTLCHTPMTFMND